MHRPDLFSIFDIDKLPSVERLLINNYDLFYDNLQTFFSGEFYFVSERLAHTQVASHNTSWQVIPEYLCYCGSSSQFVVTGSQASMASIVLNGIAESAYLTFWTSTKKQPSFFGFKDNILFYERNGLNNTNALIEQYLVKKIR